MFGSLFFACFDTIYRCFCFTPRILPHTDVVEQIVKYRLSLARFGDGELKCIVGRDINFQPASKRLSEKLCSVFQNCSLKLLIGIPDIFEHLERYNADEQRFWRYHLRFSRWNWYRYLHHSHSYASTFLSRFYSMEYDRQLASSRLKVLKQLWDKRNVIFVEGVDSKLGVGNDLFDNTASIRRILCPNKDAFSCYDDIKRITLEMAHTDDLIILALGPTATVLAAELCQSDLQALDLGHIDIEYEWFLQGVSSKTAVKGKFCNEAYLSHLAISEVQGQLFDETYNSQVVAIIN